MLKMGRFFTIFIVFCLGVSSRITCDEELAPVIVNQAKDKLAVPNTDVTFNCYVKYGHNFQVGWFMPEQNLQISKNAIIFAAPQNQYQVIEVRRDKENIIEWNLLIKNVTDHDHGLYECRILGMTNIVQQNRLRIKVCCKALNVSSACMNTCAFAAYPLHRTRCTANDLEKMLKCGTDHGNHVRCCLRRRVHPDCYDLCSGKVTSLRSHHNVCMRDIFDIAMCLEEGQVTIPSQPLDVSAQGLGDTSVLVNWSPPAKNAKMVTGYRVFYQQVMPDSTPIPAIPPAMSTSILSNDTKFAVLTSLKTYQRYLVHVIAIGPHGSSKPSTQVEVVASKGNVDKFRPGGSTVKDCCVAKGMTQKCIDYMCGGPVNTADIDSYLSCTGEAHKAYQCFAGNRNHTSCCALIPGIVPTCLELCSGAPPTYDLKHLACLPKFDEISNCFAEGLALLPGPPIRAYVNKIDFTEALIHWSKPTLNADRVNEYIVKYRLRSSSESYTLATTVNRYIQLKDLKPDKMYEAMVVAANSKGESIPTSKLIFLTHGETGETGTMNATKPFANDNTTDMAPTSPVNVRIASSGVDAHSISVVWDKPRYAPYGITQYRIEWSMDENFFYSANTKLTSYKIQGLQPSTSYNIRLIAINPKAESSPSDMTQQMTRDGVVVVKPTNPPPIQSFSDCCNKSGVNPACVPLCEGKTVSNVVQCSKDLDKIVICLSDRRNHDSCCNQRHVPSVCLPYCHGKSQGNTYAAVGCMLHIDSMRSCFFSNYYDLPTAPEEFVVTSVGVNSLTCSWKPPASNQVGIKYIFFYRADLFYSRYTAISNATSPMTLKYLYGNQFYEIFVIAHNNLGSSLPSTMVRVRTLQYSSQNIRVSQIPSGVVRRGQDVTLTCHILNPQSTTYLKWQFQQEKNPKVTGQVGENLELVLKSVSGKQAGLYACSELDDKEAVINRIKVNLEVRDTPEVRMDGVEKVGVNEVTTAVDFICHIYGSPTTVRWFSEPLGIEINSRMNHFSRFNRLNHDGEFESWLAILGVTPKDFGIYKCVASNEFGTATGRFLLYDENGNVTEPAAEPVLNVRACCEKRNVTADCLDACTVDIDATFLQDNFNKCVNHVNSAILCAADGKDHSSCCKSIGVPSYCTHYCSGHPVSYNRILDCMMYMSKIVNCMEQGRHILPSKPRNLRGNAENSAIFIEWDVPANQPGYVQYYLISYKAYVHSREIDEQLKVGRSLKMYRIRHLIAGIKYYISLEAVNHYGRSHPSDTLIISTLGPDPPNNLKAALKPDGKSLTLTWSGPIIDDVDIQKYIIYYYPSGSRNPLTRTVDATVYSLVIDHLLPQTIYYIYMKSATNETKSGPTNTIKITSGGRWFYDKSNPGLAIGLGIFIPLLLVAIGLVGIFYYYRMYKNAPPKESPVSFENPAYRPRQEVMPDGGGTMMPPPSIGVSSVQISGIGENNIDQQPIGNNAVGDPNTTMNPYAECDPYHQLDQNTQEQPAPHNSSSV
ncbi:Ig-like and fibronectin type-III domain-containing protein 2 [Tubulanus polymorphus]|uniref:Ig-like and fibronectin type-III domain-containing protein 2 n=1 Tax=Tubulanus polymorphus TaxID=672921 RepID=UPI003DA38FC8